ncbi:RUN and FYVE domain-containing protein 4 [Geospiza fortis]|uniref:RUN and FYVE domain-containing protein 4 n=1 Tax=Geospiza fortis TaxID=48883 RepID=A0A8N5EMM6_GEOFO|nr:RUN and FYVE domain-containing protein 4 [Geospiza fortis]
MAGEGELNRVIKDLQKTVAELKCSYQEQNLPVTDGSRELHSLCAQLEFLLQFDLKEKRSFFGQRKDYWDFLCQGLARCRQEHEGIHFVTSLDKLKTPVGRGRAFLRYCLVHRQLAESLQLCLLDPESLCEWYYARSPFLSPKRRAEILGSLYELDCVTFHLALYRSDLDTAWPMFSEPLVRPSPVIRSSPAKTALQTDRMGTVAHGWSDGTGHPTVALHGAPAHPCPPTWAALQAGSVQDTEEDVEDGQVKKNMEEEDEEEVEEDDSKDTKDVKVEDVEVDVEEDLEEKHEELEEDEKDMKDVDVEELEDAHGTGKAAQPGTSPLSPGTRCMLGSLSLVPRQPGGTEQSLQALVSQLRAELGQQEAAAQALAARLARADWRQRRQEEGSARWAQLWARQEEALRETNAFLQRALEAAVAAGDPGALERAQEEARRWQEVAEERGTQLARALERGQSRQQLQAQRQEMARLQEELSRARQDGGQELIRDMKGRLLELLREKDALWQKTEGIDTPVPSPVPRDPGLCARCHKDFRLLSRRYSCRLCQGKVCHTCSVDMGKHGRCCLICYQQRHPQAT